MRAILASLGRPEVRRLPGWPNPRRAIAYDPACDVRAPSTSVSDLRDVGVTRPPVFAPEEVVSGAPAPLAAPDDVGRLGVWRLKRMWSRSDAIRRGLATEPYEEVRDDHLVLDAIGLGFEQASIELMRCTSFESFEDWIVAVTGGIDADAVARVNAALAGTRPPEATRRALAEIDGMAPVLDEADLRCWDELGYVVVTGAVADRDREGAIEALCEHIGADLDDPESWYRPNDHGIMVQLFQHPALEGIRRSPRLHKAFAQLWGTSDLWVSTDRMGFNPPERPGHEFPGPDLHWDVSLTQPIPLGTQGLVYLTDTEPEQGALTVVPAFHRRIEAWLGSLPAGTEPRAQALHDLGSVAIAGRAGDAVIWHQALPHGSRPNRAARPRLVQYVNRYPIDYGESSIWR